MSWKPANVYNLLPCGLTLGILIALCTALTPKYSAHSYRLCDLVNILCNIYGLHTWTEPHFSASQKKHMDYMKILWEYKYHSL